MSKKLLFLVSALSFAAQAAHAVPTDAYVFRVDQTPNGYFYPILLVQEGPARREGEPATKRVELKTCFFDAGSVPRTAEQITAALPRCRTDERHHYAQSAPFGHGNHVGFMLYVPSRDWLVFGSSYAGSVGSGYGDDPSIRIDHGVEQLLVSLGGRRPSARELRAGLDDEYSYKQEEGLSAVTASSAEGRPWEFLAKARLDRPQLPAVATLVH